MFRQTQSGQEKDVVFTSFDILPPALIPTPDYVQAVLPTEILNHLTARASNGRWISNMDAAAALLVSLETLQQDLPNDGGQRGAQDGEGGNTKLSRDDNAHDEYFRIRRSGGPAHQVFVHTILSANLILFEDSWNSPFTIDPEKLNCLDSALNSLLLWTLGLLPQGEIPAAPRVTGWISHGSVYHSMARWVRGHQIFAALTQGLTAVFRDLKIALQMQDNQRVSQAVQLAVLLLHGSAASLEFTGDFPSQDYIEIIRPSMMPPLVPDTFSGLLSIDHRYFIQLLREMKPWLDSLAEYPAAHHQQIASAVACVYDSHRFVCDRLVGKSPSLMMATGSKKSGAEQIEKFKHLRLRVFEPETRAAMPETALHESGQSH